MHNVPIRVPDDWHDDALLTFEQFCTLVQIPARTVRDWRRRRVGPRFHKLDGTGRLYLTVAETRRFLNAATLQDTRKAAPTRVQETKP